MDHFNTGDDGQLYAEQVSLTEVAARFGTPTYVYSRATLTRHFNAYSDTLKGRPHLICYAVKANSNLGVLDVLAKLGAGFDIVSVGELERVIRAGGDPAKVVFSGVGKQPHEMVRALQAGIHCFNVESREELEVLNRVAGEQGLIAPVSLRVNPDVDAKTHPYISTGLKDNKFGIDISDALATYQRAAELPNLKVIGVDCHIGSQLTEAAPFVDALQRVLKLVDELAENGIALKHLDIGGGLGVTYNNETPPSPDEYIKQLLPYLQDRDLELIVEPGRSIAANAGVLLTQVNLLKLGKHKNFAVVDAAMNDMLRPSLYQAWMKIEPVNANSTAPTRCYDIVGAVCETGDFLGKDRDLAIAEGDLLCLRGAGAYGFTMSSNYNSRGRAAEVIVDGDTLHLVRERETFEDLIRGESVISDSAKGSTGG
ncbi:diaminopimelate decarboxylase [Porticoccaceae bacterium LTM1]|nr:diaminopimelate decarboxylase [Porticoccaceae bacterium LTM1]